MENVEKMNPYQRKQFRFDFLREIYHYYFNNLGKPYEILVSKENDTEKYLAIQYLINKKFIANTSPNYDKYSLTITHEGMDLVESK